MAETGTGGSGRPSPTFPLVCSTCESQRLWRNAYFNAKMRTLKKVTQVPVASAIAEPAFAGLSTTRCTAPTTIVTRTSTRTAVPTLESAAGRDEPLFLRTFLL